MRIALYHNLPSGGAKRAIFEIVRRLTPKHMVDIFTLSSANHSFCDLRPYARQYNVYDFESLPLFRSPLGRLNQIQRLRDFRRLESLDRRIAADIDTGQYDVVYVHPSMWLQAPNVLKYVNSPTIYHVQESLRSIYEPVIPRPYLEYGWRAQLNKLDLLISLYRRELVRLDRHNVRQATRLLANSHFTASNVRAIYGCEAEVASFGVDGEVFHPLPVGDADFVLSVGELRPNKGYDFLIDAIARIPSAVRPPLRIISNTYNEPEHDYLLCLAVKCGVNLTIEVMVSLETLVRRYNEAALFVYAPVREPFGLVALESMACGTAVVGVAEGGVSETVVDGVTGLLTPRDPARFAAAIYQLLQEPDQARRMGQAGREHVLDTWIWDRSVARIESALAATARTSESFQDRVANGYEHT